MKEYIVLKSNLKRCPEVEEKYHELIVRKFIIFGLKFKSSQKCSGIFRHSHFTLTHTALYYLQPHWRGMMTESSVVP